MMIDPATLSPAMTLLSLLWQRKSARITERQRDEGMRHGLDLALQMGLPFALEDFAWLSTERGATSSHPSACGFRVWGTQGYLEGTYGRAIQARNTSACLAYEHWRTRTPFFWQGQRLYVGAGLDWEGQARIVTSFDDSAGTLTACAYKKITVYGPLSAPRVHGEGPPTQRTALTPQMLRAARQVVPGAAGKEAAP